MNTEQEKKADIELDPKMAEEASRLALRDADGTSKKNRYGKPLGVEIVTAQQIYEEMIKGRDDG